MGASRARRERRESRPAVLEAQTEQRRRTRRKYLILGAVILAVLLAAGTAIGLLSSGYLAAHTTAARVGEHAISGAEFTYFYMDAYQAFSNENAGLLSQVLDPQRSFDSQIYNEEDGATWADFFLGEAAVDAGEIYRMYDAAMAAGYVLDADGEAALAQDRAALEATPGMLPGVDDADDYLRAAYGRGCTLESYMAYARVRRIADGYAAHYRAQLQYTDDQRAAAYAAAPEDFDTVSYKIFYSSVITGKNDDGTVQVDMAQSEANGRRMAEECRGNVDRFNELTVELAAEKRKDTYRDPSFSLRRDMTVSSANEVLRDWLSDPARQYGDTVCLQADERGYYVGFFLDYKDNDFDLASIRQIPVRAYANADDPDDADGMKRAGKSAREILDAFEAGPHTAEAFAALAAEKTTQETVSSPYVPGALDAAVDQWCYGETRQSGDYAVLKGATGYYVVWFDGYDAGLYRDYLIDEKLRGEDYDAWHADVVAGDPAVLYGAGLYCMSK